MQTVTSLENVGIAELSSYLLNCTQAFEASQLYSSATDTKFVDEELRRSRFRAIADPVLFDLCEPIVGQLNASDAVYTYTLRRNDVTHIKYAAGGYFKRHKDYLSTTSNLVEEFSMVLCVTPLELAQCRGSETVLHHADDSSTSFRTTIPGEALVFRKDIEHEGALLLEGEKHVVTLNLWATKKTTGQVMLVTFPPAAPIASSPTLPARKKTKTRGGSRQEAVRQIQEAADAQSSYALPADSLSGPLLAKLRWANRQAEEKNEAPPAVVPYCVEGFTFQEFGTVTRVLQRAYIDASDLVAHKLCLDFFGLLNLKDFFVSLATVSPAAPATATAPSATVAIDESADSKYPSLLLCENESRTTVLAELSRELEVPLVQFKMLFVEGTAAYVQGDASIEAEPYSIPMTAVFISLGDYDNIFSIVGINGRDECEFTDLSLKELAAKHDFWHIYSPADNLANNQQVNLSRVHLEDSSLDREINELAPSTAEIVTSTADVTRHLDPSCWDSTDSHIFMPSLCIALSSVPAEPEHSGKTTHTIALAAKAAATRAAAAPGTTPA